MGRAKEILDKFKEAKDWEAELKDHKEFLGLVIKNNNTGDGVNKDWIPLLKKLKKEYFGGIDGGFTFVGLLPTGEYSITMDAPKRIFLSYDNFKSGEGAGIKFKTEADIIKKLNKIKAIKK